MSVQSTIEQKLQQGLNIRHLEIDNESHMHSGPATDSHFRLVLVSDDFVGKRLVQRHQLIYGLLSDEMQNPIHALAMHLYTGEEWQLKNGQAPQSPQCLGGSKGG
ncbi:DNA-binding transcriptional regulator BolA [Marinobacterium nitratireducens]|uniref:DNA-binding transcriptional regulator BolA n=1 Tax=Marinobacterium nitratireducens TaxID=518897 RepID=A0A917ZNP0_9GAMM|nr:BolA family protein [Marinobacterium nitratireducens]GGO87453.1 DNA-binding transcriptional regulator BolA [Marinobacterium nitratireducens]